MLLVSQGPGGKTPWGNDARIRRTWILAPHACPLDVPRSVHVVVPRGVSLSAPRARTPHDGPSPGSDGVSGRCPITALKLSYRKILDQTNVHGGMFNPTENMRGHSLGWHVLSQAPCREIVARSCRNCSPAQSIDCGGRILSRNRSISSLVCGTIFYGFMSSDSFQHGSYQTLLRDPVACCEIGPI